MEKTHAELQREEIEAHKRGEFRYEPDPPYVIVRDPKNLEKRLNAIRRLNGIPEKKLTTGVAKSVRRVGVQKNIPVSPSAYSKLSLKAKRAKLSLTMYVEKLAGE